MIPLILTLIGLGAGFGGLAYGYFVLGPRDIRARTGSRFYSIGGFPLDMRYMRVSGSSNPDDDGVYYVVDLKAPRQPRWELIGCKWHED